jgi:hypothetical protein
VYRRSPTEIRRNVTATGRARRASTIAREAHEVASNGILIQEAVLTQAGHLRDRKIDS